MVAPPDDRRRRRGALLVLVCLCVFAQPVLGNGPGPDPATVYEAEPIDTEPPHGVLVHHPAVSGDFVVEPTVTDAAEEPFRVPVEDAAVAVLDLQEVEFFFAETELRYYAVDARVRNGTFLLDSRPVAPREVAAALAVPVGEVDPPVRRAARTGRAYADYGPREGTLDREPTVVALDGGYVLVTRERDRAPDPYRAVKLGAYGLAGLGVIAGVVLHTLAGAEAGTDA